MKNIKLNRHKNMMNVSPFKQKEKEDYLFAQQEQKKQAELNGTLKKYIKPENS